MDINSFLRESINYEDLRRRLLERIQIWTSVLYSTPWRGQQTFTRRSLQ